MNEPILLYKQAHAIHVNTPSDPLFYYFDYDERSYSINMEFQHFHDFYEIHILLDAKAMHTIEGNLYTIQQYDIVLLKPSLLHKTQYPEGPPHKRLIINFAIPREIEGLTSGYEAIFSVFDQPIPIFRFPEKIQKNLFTYINDIFKLSLSHSPHNPVAIHCKFTEFLCALYLNQQHNSYVPQEVGDSTTQKIYAITSHIHSNYKEQLSLESLSKMFYISSYYLSHQFKKVTGFTLTSYIQMTRIRTAQLLLMNSNMKITEIAEQCGFTSFSQFNRIFNKHNDMSPSAYRQAIAKNPFQGAVD
ncbi:AraC family transcriptional regulator [Paenibacillus tarimensis]